MVINLNVEKLVVKENSKRDRASIIGALFFVSKFAKKTWHIIEEIVSSVGRAPD